MSYRYIGNKTRLLPALMEIIEPRVEQGGVVADLMCGTGTVAAGLRARGFRVVASDLMTFAYLHARVRLTMRRAPAFKFVGGYQETLDLLNRLQPTRGLFFREYSPLGKPRAGVPPRGYFTAQNAGRLDSIATTLRLWREERAITEPEFALLRHDLVLAANRVANIAGTYGHFRSKLGSSARAQLSMRPTEFATAAGPIDHVVKIGAAEVVAQGLAAHLCYLDPPYTKRQYAANYHMLETIARCDEPEAIGVSGLRPWRDQYSDFCSKLRVRDSFRAIVSGMDCPRFLVSYSEEGLLSRDDMESLFSEFGDVEVIEIQAKRFRSQRMAPRSSVVTEYVFDLRKR